MPSSGTTEANESSDRDRGTRQPASREIDLKALAKKVYKLFQEEARLERERRGWRQTR